MILGLVNTIINASINTLLIGTFESNCIQTQNQNHQGYLKEIYHFDEKNPIFSHEKAWYSDPQCSDFLDSEFQEGKFQIGKKIPSFFSQAQNFEIDFLYDQQFDLGIVTIVDENTIKIGRGMVNSQWRNTMPSLFEFKKNLNP